MSEQVQGSPEWLELRRKSIGSSDAPVIMGVSPYKTPRQLWREKRGEAEAPAANPAMRRGTALESTAREAFEKIMGVDVFPTVLVHPEHAWMIASLDGLSLDGKLAVEIKCPRVEDHQEAKHGRVPEHYYPQVQHQMAVAGLDYMYYFSWRDDDGVAVKVDRDDEYIAKMLEAEREFLDMVEQGKEPAMAAKDSVYRKDYAWTALADRYKIAKAEAEKAAEAAEALRQQLIEMAGGHSTEGGGIRVMRFERAGSVDYSKIPELKGINLDQYRKDGTAQWRVSVE